MASQSSKPTPSASSSAMAATTLSSDRTAVRKRVPLRQSSPHNLSPASSRSSPQPPPGRRSSMLSLTSIDGVTSSLTSDIINPSLTRSGRHLGENDQEEVTHWYSTPLLFAILPAIGGVFFQEGAAVMTDLLILGLAAIFMNWSIRLPWDWYYSARMMTRNFAHEDSVHGIAESEGTGVESETTSETGKDSATNERSPSPRPRLAGDTSGEDQRKAQAAMELRRQELWALGSTFIFPALAAYFLHALRSQLSRPSEGLVSDYNLSVFLLVSEIRPCRQVIRLLEKRTLHLQRVATGLEDPFASNKAQIDATSAAAINALTSRLESLESNVTRPNTGPAPTTQTADTLAELRKRYEPRLEALERAMRRYEKRSATLAMVTDQRLATIETRLSDTLSLAAAAARHKSGTVVVVEKLVAVCQWPVRLALWPVRAGVDMFSAVRVWLFGPPRRVREGGGKGKKGVKGT